MALLGAAILFLAFGVVLLVLPESSPGLAGVDLNASGAVLARLVGGMNIAAGTAVLALRGQPHRGVLLGLALGELIHTPIIVWAAMSGVMNGLGYAMAAVSAAIGIALVYGARVR